MNLKQALKRKNRLVGLIAETYKNAFLYNSMEEGVERPYSTKDSIEKWMKLTDELIELKCKIQTANNSVNNLIFRLSELKSQAKLLKELNCASGIIHVSTHRGGDKQVIKTAELGIIERDQMVAKMESEIEQIQEKLDQYNHETLIS
jgi:uncharacterized phage infection (PIP) family protein YhgE